MLAGMDEVLGMQEHVWREGFETANLVLGAGQKITEVMTVTSEQMVDVVAQVSVENWQTGLNQLHHMQQQVFAALYEIDPACAVALIEKVTSDLKDVHNKVFLQVSAKA